MGRRILVRYWAKLANSGFVSAGQPKAARENYQVNTVMPTITSVNVKLIQMPVAEQQTHAVAMGVLAVVITLAKYGVKPANLVFVSVETMILVKETHMENIVTYRTVCANAHPILMPVVEIDPNV